MLCKSCILQRKSFNFIGYDFMTVRRHIHLTKSHHVQKLQLSYSIHQPTSGTPAGHPFLITHGLLGAKNNWTSVAKAVSRVTNRKVITFDARNHGDSPHFEEHSYTLMADDLKKFVDDLGIQKCSLMGHSMGGRTVMAFALMYPQLIEKLVVVDVSPISMSSDFPQMKIYLETLQSINFELGRKIPLSEGRKIAEKGLSQVVPDPSVRAFLLTNLAELDGKIYWKPNLPVLIKTIQEIGSFPTELLSKVSNADTLFIRGEKSPYIVDEDIPGIKELFPNSKFETIRNSGHWPHADNVQDFLTVLLNFIK